MVFINSSFLTLLVGGGVVSVAAFAPHSHLGVLSSRTATTLWSPLRSAVVLEEEEKVNGVLTKSSDVEKNNTTSFDWFKNWYPLMPVEYLDDEKPHKFDLLGMPVVVWKDSPVEGRGIFASKKGRKRNAVRSGGEWRVFRDECPHRKVPLSEGRVEDDGTLLCSYHAFRFDGDGALVNIPQVPQSELESIQKNPKSNCQSFPTQIINGVLWVWPQTGAALEAALTPASSFTVPEEDRDRVWEGPWNFRELPYSADYFIENVVDGNHAEVSHHNVVGDRYKVQNAFWHYESKLTPQGFAVRQHLQKDSVRGDPGSYTTFQAPCNVNLDIQFEGKDGPSQVLELYATPTRPGFCMHIGRMVIIKDKSAKIPPFLRAFTLPMPKWLNHIGAATFLNQDAVFLHQQERNLAASGQYISFKESESVDYVKNVMPVDTDRGVINFRTWMRVFAGGHIPYQNAPQELPPIDNDVCFDQYKTHTAHCKACQGALKNLKKVRLASFLVSAVLSVWRPSKLLGLNLAATLLTAGLGFGLNKFIQLFYRYEFSHAQND